MFVSRGSLGCCIGQLLVLQMQKREGATDITALLASHSRAKKKRRRQRAAGDAAPHEVNESERDKMLSPDRATLVAAAKAAQEKLSVVVVASSLRSMPSARTSVVTLYPVGKKHGGLQKAWVSDDWLKSLDPPGCGMGNKFFLYSLYRLYGKWKSKRVHFFSTAWLEERYTLEKEIKYDLGALDPVSLTDMKVGISMDGEMLRGVFQHCNMYLQWSPAILVHAKLVYSWFTNFIESCVAASIKKHGTVSSNDLVIHLRTGDVWEERVRTANIVNGGFVFYAQPPAWFYSWLLREHTPYENVLIVTYTTECAYTHAVIAALESVPAVQSVKVCKGTILEDFGLLLQARHLVSSVSTFSWWAVFLGNYHHYRTLSDAKTVVSESELKISASRRQVYVPLSGYFHPESAHRCECCFEFDDACNLGVCDRYEFLLEKDDLWQNSNEQRSKAFAFEVPEWFLKRCASQK